MEGGAKKKKANDSSEKVNSANDKSTPDAIDLSKHVAQLPSLNTSTGKPIADPMLDSHTPAISERFANTDYDFFLGKRVAYPVVANYVKNTWGKYGLVKSMFSSSTGLFSFQFSSMDDLNAMLENGP
ncbi:hypothetical protein Tco_1249512 [Tanacetum coccineum]